VANAFGVEKTSQKQALFQGYSEGKIYLRHPRKTE
jgi:hypothetical protein